MKTQMSDWGSSRPQPSSGDGDGCRMTVVAGVAAALILTTVGILVADSAEAVVPRRTSRCSATVPDTYGFSEQAGRDALASAGFTTYVWMNKEAGQWTVVYSSPQPGTVVNRCVDPLVEIWIGQ